MSRNISRRDLLTKVVPAAAATVASSRAKASASSMAFHHGVASGDPTQSQLIIWSRITTNQKSVAVQWEVSTQADFSNLVKTGLYTASHSKDHTVKIDVEKLTPNTQYYYRFSVGELISPAGMARTLPEGKVSSFKMGVCSCSNYPAGYFNAYAAMAEREDLDVVLHLGDYIYEYDALGYASSGAEALGRVSEPLNEVTTLMDFRRRHAQYKSDKNLQRLHAKLPFILTWDDHEFANDSWHGGAENHNPGEGEWAERKAAGLQAYYEWMPIREPSDRALSERWRSFEIGSLASLILLETRISARDEQVSASRDMTYVSAKFDLSDPQNPVFVEDENAVLNEVSLVEVKLPHDIRKEKPRAIKDYALIQELQAKDELPEGYAYIPDMQRFRREILDNPKRQLLGPGQRDFVAKSLSESRRGGKRWQLVANQTLVAKVDLPNLADKLSKQEQEHLSSWLKPGLPLSRLGLPFGTDSWNGYGAERENFLNQAAKSDTNLIVLTGDTHAAWGLDLQPQDNDSWQGIELGVTSISSPGLPKALGVEAGRLSELLLETNTNLNYSETAHHGFLCLELTQHGANAEFHRISTVAEKNYADAGSDKFTIKERATLKGLEMKSV